MEISKDTQVFISIAERPGNFGATVHNAGFKSIGFPGIYLPFKVKEADLPGAVSGIRSLGIKGCGVSMPHKTSVMDLLDNIDYRAKKIGAVNTIINKNSVLTGYNTDCDGAMEAISEAYDISGKTVLLIGAGGVARAIIVALQEIKAKDICVMNRDEIKAFDLAREFGIMTCSYNSRNHLSADLLINATPVGMSPNTGEMIIDEGAIKNFEAIMDVIIYPSKTLLMKKAKDLGKLAISGFRMSLYQAAKQFNYYTNQTAPIEIMLDALRNFSSEH